MREKEVGRRLAALVTVAVLAGAAAGCGSSKPAGSGSARGGATTDGQAQSQALSAAYAATQSAKTAKVTLKATVSSPNGAITTTGSGAFRWSPVAGELASTFAFPGGDSAIADERVIGSNVYLHSPALPASLLGGNQWIGFDLGSMASFLNSPMGINPAQVLSLLESHGSSVTRVGTDVIGGATTTHYRAILPTSDIQTRDPQVNSEIQQLAAAGMTQIPLDVWVDSSGRPRQVSLTETIPKAPGGSEAAVGSAFPMTVDVVLGLSDYGTPVSVSAPPASQVMTFSLEQLLQLEQLALS